MFAFFDRKILRSVTHFQSQPGVAKHFQANGNDKIFNFNKRVCVYVCVGGGGGGGGWFEL